MTRVYEYCPHCEGESEYEMEDKDIIERKGIVVCQHCGVELLLCSVCTERNCKTCSSSSSSFELNQIDFY